MSSTISLYQAEIVIQRTNRRELLSDWKAVSELLTKREGKRTGKTSARRKRSRG